MSDLDWEVPPDFGQGVDNMAFPIAIAVANEARNILHDQVPDLAGLTSIEAAAHCNAHFNTAGWFVLRVIFNRRAGAHSLGPMAPKDIELLNRQIAGNLPAIANLEQAEQLLGSEWIGPDRMTYAGRYDGRHVSWSHISSFIVDWLNDVVLPHASNINRARVLRAIPAPPAYDISRIADALWVLESEQACRQGSAFMLKDVGLVTCAHCVFGDTKAFSAAAPTKKFPVSITKRHCVIDLAVCRIDRSPPQCLPRGQPSELKVTDHLLVCGHPNYRVGDSVMIVPGIVVGFRMKSAVRRIMTNASIVGGASGGPVLDQGGNVIGVAVTGSESFASAPDTEDHGIIPIDALDLF